MEITSGRLVLAFGIISVFGAAAFNHSRVPAEAPTPPGYQAGPATQPQPGSQPEGVMPRPIDRDLLIDYRRFKQA